MKISTMRCIIWILAFLSAAPAFGSSCDSLAKLVLKDTTVTTAQIVPAGKFSPPGEGQPAGGGANPYKELPEFCRVAATIKPTSDSDIKVEVWLPADGWNGKFQAVGTEDGLESSAIPPWLTPSAQGMRARPPTPDMWGGAGLLRSVIPKSSSTSRGVPNTK